MFAIIIIIIIIIIVITMFIVQSNKTITRANKTINIKNATAVDKKVCWLESGGHKRQVYLPRDVISAENDSSKTYG